MALLAAALGSSLASGIAAPPEPVPLRVGMPRLAFYNLNEADAAAAYRTLIISAARQRGYEVKPELVTFDDLSSLDAAVSEGTVQVCLVGSWQLFESKIADFADIAFVPASNGRATRKLLLLVERGGRVQRVEDLRAASVMLLRDPRVNLTERWLDVLCLRAGLGLAAGAVQLDIVARPSSALLPVFFGRSEACVVDEDSFALASELNPQLRDRLVAIAESQPLLDSVICINRRGWPVGQQREDLIRSLGDLHREPSGRQLLTMFRMDQLKQYTTDLLENVAALHREHVELSRDRSANPAGP
jgi:phosphonate transport system substrate-binding protein